MGLRVCNYHACLKKGDTEHGTIRPPGDQRNSALLHARWSVHMSDGSISLRSVGYGSMVDRYVRKIRRVQITAYKSWCADRLCKACTDITRCTDQCGKICANDWTCTDHNVEACTNDPSRKDCSGKTCTNDPSCTNQCDLTCSNNQKGYESQWRNMHESSAQQKPRA